MPMMRLRGIAWDWQIELLGRTEEQNKALAQFQRLRSQIALQQGTSTPGEVTKQVLQNGEVQ